MDVFDAARRYGEEGTPVVILAGKEYGSGSSRDWAAKGPWMQVSVCVLFPLTMHVFLSFFAHLRWVGQIQSDGGIPIP